MKTTKKPPVDPAAEFDRLGLDLSEITSKITQTEIDQIVATLYSYLQQASQVEHLLAMQYLFSAFTMKKFPEEFDDYPNVDVSINEKRLAQLEAIRRWEAEILFVSRQEMEHLNLVQNLIVILGQQPYLYRPNFPVPGSQNILQLPINLMPFSEVAIEIFRYWEKPDGIVLPDPFLNEGMPKGVQSFGKAGPHPTSATPHDGDATKRAAFDSIVEIVNHRLGQEIQFTSIEEMYSYVWL